jgi:hypothetical protein
MLRDLEGKTKKELAEIALIQQEEYQCLQKLIVEMESQVNKYTRQDLVWFARHEVKGLDREQNGVIDLNKIKADAVRDAIRHRFNSLCWDWSKIDAREYISLLEEYADNLERGDL